MSDAVKIVLDNYINDVCYPGQTLAGRVECNFSKEENVKAIKLKFKGRAKTEFNLRYSRADIPHYGKEVYFDQEFDLVPGGDNFHLNAGTHTYPFSYILPQSLPPSFEGMYGKVVYTIKVKVERPWKIDFKEKIKLNVASLLDLNMLPGLEEPCAVSVDNEVSLMQCLGSEPISLTVSLPCKGFAEGQDMQIETTVKNMTNVNVQYLRFNIMEELTFMGHTRTQRQGFKEYTKLIEYCKSSEGVGAHAEKTWTTNLTIPKNTVFNFLPCSVINVAYKLKIKLVLPFPYSSFKTDLPITLGTIPLSGGSTGLLQQTTFYSSKSTVPPNTTLSSGTGFGSPHHKEAAPTEIHVDVIQQKNFYPQNSNNAMGAIFTSKGIAFPSGDKSEIEINMYESNLNGRGPMVTSCFDSENVSYVSHRTTYKTPSTAQRKYM